MKVFRKGRYVCIIVNRVERKVLPKTLLPRSYSVQQGTRIYRINRNHLVPSPDFEPESEPNKELNISPDNHLTEE